MDAMERVFAELRERLTDLVHFAGPYALPAMAAAVLLLLIVKRDRVVSPGGAIVLLALAALAVTVRAIQLGRF